MKSSSTFSITRSYYCADCKAVCYCQYRMANGLTDRQRSKPLGSSHSNVCSVFAPQANGPREPVGKESTTYWNLIFLRAR